MTCLAQEFDDYEIIVCDNCSSPSTAKLVADIQSKKIRYIRSNHPLAMSDNWDLALSHTKGEYVGFIGDDDGLLLNALVDINSIIDKLQPNAIRWNWVHYLWPSFPLENEAGRLAIPLLSEDRLLDPKPLLSKVANSALPYTSLPMIYHGFVHRRLIIKAIEKIGRLFPSESPDVFSGFCFGYLADTMAVSSRPMSIAGQCGASNGVGNLVLNKKHPAAQEFHSLNQSAGLGIDPRVPDLPVLPACAANAFYQAKRHLFPNHSHYDIDRKLLVNNCLEQISINSDDEWTRVLDAINYSLSDSMELKKWFNNNIPEHPRSSLPKSGLPCWREGKAGCGLDILADDFDAHDVFEVAILVNKLFGYNTRTYEWKEAPTRYPNYNACLALIKSILRFRVIKSWLYKHISFGRQQ